MNCVDSVVLLHIACLQNLLCCLGGGSPLGHNKQKKQITKTSTSPEALNLHSKANVLLKPRWYLTPFRGTGSKRAGLVSPCKLPHPGKPWTLVFTWWCWKNSTGMVLCYKDFHHWPEGLPSWSRQWGTLRWRLFGAKVHSSFPQKQKGPPLSCSPAAFPRHQNRKGAYVASAHETLCHVKGSSPVNFLA